mmetsp:Transcript_13914/g.24610  ORF Transcript_13914/g.24610 Transcript_13914/m.24610 type:complete len:209 (-) Transcript_13914:453-1079(-)
MVTQRKRRRVQCGVRGCVFSSRADKKVAWSSHYNRKHPGVPVPIPSNLQTAPPLEEQNTLDQLGVTSLAIQQRSPKQLSSPIRPVSPDVGTGTRGDTARDPTAIGFDYPVGGNTSPRVVIENLSAKAVLEKLDLIQKALEAIRSRPVIDLGSSALVETISQAVKTALGEVPGTSKTRATDPPQQNQPVGNVKQLAESFGFTFCEDEDG